jgi:hypothetical protein
VRRPPKAGLDGGANIALSAPYALLAPAQIYRRPWSEQGVNTALAIIRLIEIVVPQLRWLRPPVLAREIANCRMAAPGG